MKFEIQDHRIGKIVDGLKSTLKILYDYEIKTGLETGLEYALVDYVTDILEGKLKGTN